MLYSPSYLSRSEFLPRTIFLQHKMIIYLSIYHLLIDLSIYFSISLSIDLYSTYLPIIIFHLLCVYVCNVKMCARVCALWFVWRSENSLRG